MLLTVGLVSQAHGALHLSPTGQGQALYLPFFSAEEARATLVSLSNDDLGAARRVQLVATEARNGRVLLSATVYLLPGDTWNGAIVADHDQPARLVPRGGERSCTLSGDMVFADRNFNGANDDGLGSEVARTYRGAIEAIEVGTVHGAALAALEAGDCAALDNPASGDIGTPAGRLSMSAELIDVASGRMWGYEAIALEGFSNTARLQTTPLRFTDAQPGTDGQLEVQYYSQEGHGRNASLPAAHPEDAVSLALASWALVGDYSLSFDDTARSEWVVSFPTRHAYVDDRPGGVLPAQSGPRPPFRGSCETAPIVVLDRDGSALATPIRDTSNELRLCDQVNHFALRRPITLIPESGDGRIWIDLADLGRAPLFGTQHFGLPAIGLTLQSIDYPAERDGKAPRSFTAAHPMRKYAVRGPAKEKGAQRASLQLLQTASP